MEREEALARLDSGSWHERLRGARVLGRLATASDLQILYNARSREVAKPVQQLLDSAIRRVRHDIDAARAEEVENVPAPLVRQMQAKAVLEVTRTVLHEIEAIAGAIALAAIAEVPNFEQSNTNREIERLSRRLDALGSYRTAATAPKLTTFALGRWIKELVAQEKFDERTSVSYIGQDDLIVEGGITHLELALCNGLRNAIEANRAFPAREDHDKPRIIISWNATDAECWVTVKDDGPGLSQNAAETLPIGRSTKEHGGGTGLLIAKQAMESLDGSISLSNASDGGALFELRWFGNASPDR